MNYHLPFVVQENVAAVHDGFLYATEGIKVEIQICSDINTVLYDYGKFCLIIPINFC